MITGETGNLNGEKTDDMHATVSGARRDGKLVAVAAVTIPLVVLLVGYVTALANGPLLDEQFMLLMAHDSKTALFGWSGFEPFDHLGPVAQAALVIVGAAGAKHAVVLRIVQLLVHGLATVSVYSIGRSLRLNQVVSCVAACLFAIYPLSVEAVAWGGGLGAELSGMLVIASLAAYCRMRLSANSWKWLALSLVSYGLALAASTNFWFAPLMVLWLELAALPFRKSDPIKRDFTSIILPALMFFMVSAGFVAAAGVEVISIPNLKLANVLTLARDLTMPINQINWQHYSKEYRLAFVLMGLMVPAFAFGLWRSKEARFAALVSLGWIAIASLPFCGVLMTEPGLYGERWLYLATLPLALFAGVACSAASQADVRHKRIIQVVSVLLPVVLTGVLLRHVWSENRVSGKNAKKLTQIRKSIKTANAKVNRPYLLLRDMPERLNRAPAFNVVGPACYDTNTGMLRSNAVPDGQLKELLRQGKVQEIALRWEDSLPSFIPLDLTPAASTWLENMKPEDMAYRLSPGLEFYKTVTIDAAENCMVLETNSENGPMITLTACELSPLDGDYLYVDARIDCPQSVVAPSIELHWQTRTHKHFERKERFSYTQATVNDKQYHRYYLSLRRNGWTTGGSPQFIALGFPSGAKVWLKTIGLKRGTENCAKISPADSANLAEASAPRFRPPYVDYPSDAALGLVALPAASTSIKAKYSVENLSGADGALIEVSQPNRVFDDANSDHLSSVTFRTYSQKGVAGEVEIPVSELNGPGVYSIRVIGTKSGGGYIGMFSDPLCYQVAAGKVQP